MLKKNLVLKPNYPICGSCTGEYLRADCPKVCPYLARTVSDFLEKRNNVTSDEHKWEQVRHYPERGKNLAQCSVKYQADITNFGLVSVEALFKTEYMDRSTKACSVHLIVTGGPEKQIMDGLVELLKKK